VNSADEAPRPREGGRFYTALMAGSGGCSHPIVVLLLAAAMALCGCVAPAHLREGAAEAQVPAGGYAAAFDAARESLIGMGFELDRVDARLGIIRTLPKSSAGLATPWHREQSTLEQEVEDLFNRQFRIAVITFHLPGSVEHAPPRPQTAPGPEPLDLREIDAPLVARVEVVLERLHRAGWRLEPSAMRWSSRSFDPDLRGTGMWPQYTVAFSQDPILARRLASAIGSSRPGPAAAAP
jgi:hypothetical protein